MSGHSVEAAGLHAVPPHPLRVETNRDQSVHLRLSATLELGVPGGTVLLPKARKARALLALIALSERRTVSRRRAAATLWSSLERAPGLARLRNTLHDLKRELDDARLDVLVLENDNVVLCPGLVVDVIATEEDATEFLSDLEDLDPAFDRWLTQIRADRRRAHSPPGVAQPDLAGTSPGAQLVEHGPVLAVAPVEVFAHAADAALASSLGDAITAALIRFRWFTTIVQEAGRTGTSAEPGQGADYVLLSSLLVDADGMRLSLKLVAPKALGAVVWANSLTHEAPPNFAVQERIAAAVAARLDSELILIEAERRQRDRLSRHDSAYSLVLQAVPAIFRLDRDPFLGAGHLLDQAVSLDRESALVHSWLAYWHVFFVGQGWATNRFQAMTRAGRAAERAMMLDPKDARAVTIAGHVKAYLHKRIDEAAALHQLALELNPALPLAWQFSGMTHAYAGRLDDALVCVTEGLRLVPDAPHGFFAEGALAIIHLLRGDHDSSVAVGRRVTERHPHFTSALKSYLAALGHLDRRVEAAEVLQRLMTLEPDFSLRRFQAASPYQRPQDIDHFIAGLRLAGVT